MEFPKWGFFDSVARGEQNEHSDVEGGNGYGRFLKLFLPAATNQVIQHIFGSLIHLWRFG